MSDFEAYFKRQWRWENWYRFFISRNPKFREHMEKMRAEFFEKDENGNYRLRKEKEPT